MKKHKGVFTVVALGWVAIAVIAAMAAHDRTASATKPIVVKGNGPILFPKSRVETGIPWNSIPTEAECDINYQSFAGGPTNMELQSYFVEVVRPLASLYILSNSIPATTSNYLYSDPDWFDGDTNVALNTAETCWASIYFKLNGAAMTSNNVSDAGMLFIGKTENVGGTNYDSGYAFAVQNRTATTTNFWLPVGSSAEESTNQPAFQTGVEETLWINNGGITNTNITFKSYFAKVVAATNGTFQLTNITGNLTSTWFETNSTNYYKGQATIPLQASGTTTVLFKLKSQKFIDDSVPDCLLVFVGVSSNTNSKCQLAYVYPIDSPYEPVAAAKESAKAKESEKPKKDKK